MFFFILETMISQCECENNGNLKLLCTKTKQIEVLPI